MHSTGTTTNRRVVELVIVGAMMVALLIVLAAGGTSVTPRDPSQGVTLDSVTARLTVDDGETGRP